MMLYTIAHLCGRIIICRCERRIDRITNNCTLISFEVKINRDPPVWNTTKNEDMKDRDRKLT